MDILFSASEQYGMDTRYWGPSAWQLFHLIAFRSPSPADVLNDMKDVLPCKFCRASTTEFVNKHPPTQPYDKWLYDIHNRVNHKLRTQCAEDPSVIDPGPNPEFEEVKARYANMKPVAVPGRDFLMAIAYNFPATPEPHDMSTQREFLHHLAASYPFEELRAIFQSYIQKHEPDLHSQKRYTKWMYGLMKALSSKVHSPIKSYRGYMYHLAYYKSGCSRKTYKGKTCRKTASGGSTKSRDHRKTRRVSHRYLLA
jgi:hypothetical protein